MQDQPEAASDATFPRRGRWTLFRVVDDICRHSFGTTLIKPGVTSLEEVREQLGGQLLPGHIDQCRSESSITSSALFMTVVHMPRFVLAATQKLSRYSLSTTQHQLSTQICMGDQTDCDQEHKVCRDTREHSNEQAHRTYTDSRRRERNKRIFIQN